MSRRFKESVALLRAVAVFGVVGAACLTRPVVTSDPNLKTNFTNIIRSTAVNKLDILFMIDNSASMGDKQQLLAQAIPDMINRLVSPNCVDSMGVTVGPSTNGNCPAGSGLEFPAVHDMHLGIVSSSLGGRGSTQCDPTLPNPANMALPSHNDDHGELINRGGASEAPVPNAQPQNFLAWFPPVAQNMQPGVVAPQVAETQVGDAATAGTLIGDFAQMITGVHEHGCGFEAQNEAWYRFLVQPDPFQSINIDSGSHASYSGIDSTILTQRKAFLRDDSLVAIIDVTDETQETANPRSVGGFGWLFEQLPWPNSTTGAAPEGTIECQSTPPGDACQSCTVVPASQLATRCPNDGATGSQGYLDPSDDKINVRFFHQRQRFGVEAGYPSSRYVTGLTSFTVPDRDHEEDSNGGYIGDQATQQNCVNPLFATNLPTDPSKDLCHLTRGPRTPDLIYYALIGGVPHQFLQAAPGDAECPAGTNAADCPQKNTLTDADWQKITGVDPEHYNFSGADFHMLESEGPRPGATCLPGQSADNCDVINGREWDSQKNDLQFACVFDLPAPKDCTLMQYSGACDCSAGNPNQNTPLCQKNGATYTTTQIKGKAYPTIAELLVAHQMGAQGIVSSLCPIHTTAVNASDPVYGYRPAVNAIINRLKNALSVQCLGQKLTTSKTDGTVPCLVLMTLPTAGDENKCNNPAQGLTVPSNDVLTRFQAGPHQKWLDNGSSGPDPSSFPTCVLTELTVQANGSNGDVKPNGDCSGSSKLGWCYFEGGGGGCAQQILFTAGEPIAGASVNLQCIEQANGATGG